MVEVSSTKCEWTFSNRSLQFIKETPSHSVWSEERERERERERVMLQSRVQWLMHTVVVPRLSLSLVLYFAYAWLYVYANVNIQSGRALITCIDTVSSCIWGRAWKASITCTDTVSSCVLCIQLDTVSVHEIKASQTLPLQALKYIYDSAGVK